MAAEEYGHGEPETGEEPERPAGEDWPDASALPTPPDARLDAAFTALLGALRALTGPCAPPVGAGAFDILYASEREVVVWYEPARDGVEQREVAIPCVLLRAAWALTLRGAPVDEAALRALAPGAAGGRWLLALLAQVPGMETRREETVDGVVDREPSAEAPAHGAGGDEPLVTLIWRGATA